MAMGAYGCMNLGGWNNMDIDFCADVYDVGMARSKLVAYNSILMRRWWKYT